jgi:DNA-binding transcriptional LysR family regulator
MELRHLRSFVAVAEEQHFGRAAMRLAIVQPALTRQIQELEQHLGVTLFDRSGRNILLTNAGRSLLTDAQRVLAEIEHAGHRALMASRGQIGTLAISFVTGMTDALLLPDVLARFRTENPDVDLQLRVLSSHLQWGAVRSREANIGFVYFLPTNFPGLHTQPISRTPVLLALPRGHRLERRPKLLLRDLQDEPFVWFPRTANPTYYDHIVQACHGGGLTMRIVIEAPIEAMLMGLTAAGVGVSFVRDTGRKYPKVVVRKVEDLDADLYAHAIWRKDDRSPILYNFIAVLRDALRQQAAAASLRRRPVR